jgi:hypothetical protein
MRRSLSYYFGIALGMLLLATFWVQAQTFHLPNLSFLGIPGIASVEEEVELQVEPTPDPDTSTQTLRLPAGSEAELAHPRPAQASLMLPPATFSTDRSKFEPDIPSGPLAIFEVADPASLEPPPVLIVNETGEPPVQAAATVPGLMPPEPSASSPPGQAAATIPSLLPPEPSTPAASSHVAAAIPSLLPPQPIVSSPSRVSPVPVPVEREPMVSQAPTFRLRELSYLGFPGLISKDAESPATILAVAMPDRLPPVQVSPDAGLYKLEKTPAAAPSSTLIEMALQSNEYADPEGVEYTRRMKEPSSSELLGAAYGEQISRLFHSDLQNFYCSENTLMLGLAVAAAAPLANTRFDQNFRDWYQRQAGGSTRATDVAKVFRDFGNWEYVVPADLAAGVISHLFPDNACAAVVADFSDRSLRALPLDQDSHWHFFRSSNSASGMAFVGAVPFLTAADMTEYKALQAALIVASIAPAWSRIQSDDHYFSQVFLGWTCAYLAVRSINQTEASHVQVVPMAMPNGAGIGMLIRY